MSDEGISPGEAEELAACFAPLGTEVARHLTAADGTHKLLLRLQDGGLIECVLIQEGDDTYRLRPDLRPEPGALLEHYLGT